jgi:hypothetical protein
MLENELKGGIPFYRYIDTFAAYLRRPAQENDCRLRELIGVSKLKMVFFRDNGSHKFVITSS